MKVYNLFFRYLLLIIVGLPNLFLFYFIFTPLTVYPVFFILDLFLTVLMDGTRIYIQNYQSTINLIPACIAGSAYYLLFILNLSIPNKTFKERFIMLLYAFSAFLFINILRISTLALFLESAYFNSFHAFSWYILSILIVVLIWFSEVKLFKIKEIPFYEDIKFLYKQTK